MFVHLKTLINHDVRKHLTLISREEQTLHMLPLAIGTVKTFEPMAMQYLKQ